MLSTGLLIAEVNCNSRTTYPNSATSESNGILAMTKSIFGEYAAAFCGIIYVFIHYTLLIAYVSQAGNILSDVFHLKSFIGPLLFSCILGGTMAFGSTRLIENVNNGFVAVVLASFASLVLAQFNGIHLETLLNTSNWSAVLPAIPVMFVALVYHNIVPSICSSLQYNKAKIATTLTVGTLIPLIMFVVWIGVSLGNKTGESLAQTVGGVPISSLIQLFSESAIVTSFIGFVIGLMDFYRDIFPSNPNSNHNQRRINDLALFALVLVPPTVVATLSDPSIFITALDVAGTYGISVLFGILPILLAFKSRQNYESKKVKTEDFVGTELSSSYASFVPGGSWSLLALMSFTLFVVTQKVLN
mmetsp:Transcript_34126/g.49579  ORF Transcript_34126/g.49579 Transcript_34126/m.49579 type:complete len:359 (-) Transcript_34126:53-1129(-)